MKIGAAMVAVGLLGLVFGFSFSRGLGVEAIDESWGGELGRRRRKRQVENKNLQDQDFFIVCLSILIS
jgi:hypothetical protein